MSASSFFTVLVDIRQKLAQAAAWSAPRPRRVVRRLRADHICRNGSEGCDRCEWRYRTGQRSARKHCAGKLSVRPDSSSQSVAPGRASDKYLYLALDASINSVTTKALL